MATIAASVVFAVWQIAHGGLQASDTAGLLGLPAGVAGAAAAVAALRKPIEGNDAELARGWAKTLAQQVETGEGEVRRQLLGADTQRINLAYVLHPAGGRVAAAPPAGLTFTDGAAAGLPDVVDYYNATRPQRLVITGVAGAGKTVLALELMLALLDNRADDAPVPVRMPSHSGTPVSLSASCWSSGSCTLTTGPRLGRQIGQPGHGSTGLGRLGRDGPRPRRRYPRP